MTWNGNSYPDADKNLPDNRVGLAENFQYIEDEMDLDHYWTDADSNNNGRHKQVNMNTGAADAAMSRDGVVYVKTTSHTLGDQHSLMYRQDSTNDIAFPITPGIIWGFAVFSLASGVPTMVESKNLTVAYASGVYTFTFDTAAPHVNYMIWGSSHWNGAGNDRMETFANNSSFTPTVNAFKMVVIDSVTAKKITGAQVNTAKAYVMAIV